MAGNTRFKYKVIQGVSCFVNEYLKEIPKEAFMQ